MMFTLADSGSPASSDDTCRSTSRATASPSSDSSAPTTPPTNDARAAPLFLLARATPTQHYKTHSVTIQPTIYMCVFLLRHTPTTTTTSRTDVDELRYVRFGVGRNGERRVTQRSEQFAGRLVVAHRRQHLLQHHWKRFTREQQQQQHRHRHRHSILPLTIGRNCFDTAPNTRAHARTVGVGCASCCFTTPLDKNNAIEINNYNIDCQNLQICQFFRCVIRLKYRFDEPIPTHYCEPTIDESHRPPHTLPMAPKKKKPMNLTILVIFPNDNKIHKSIVFVN
jgi:hypothetical protein